MSGFRKKSGSDSGSGGGGAATASFRIESVLQSLAPSDAQHDFGTDKPTTTDQKQAYNSGLYKVDRNADIVYKSEGESLMGVIKNPPNYEPIIVANPGRQFCHNSQYDVETVNGHNYKVHYADVKWMTEAKKAWNTPNFEKVKQEINAKASSKKSESSAKKKELSEMKKKSKISGFIDDLKDLINKVGGDTKTKESREEINAPMFYELMGLDVNQTIAIVVDAASIGIIQILSTGTFTGQRPTVYYIYGPEVEHDPATKKHPASPEFKDPATWTEGVIFVPCVSLNPKSFVYCYNYIPDDPSNLYLNNFFTNYQFELSELRETPKGKTTEFSTDLTIKAIDSAGKITFIDESIDSKSKSDITFLTKIIEVLKNSLKSNTEKEFKYTTSFLKKMSGDWLQVLLAAAIAARTRGFTPYKGARENVTAKIDRVFFVTHDQIALSFALLMGVECLFTHHCPVEGNDSLHSAFLYSLASEETVNAAILNKAKTKLAENPKYAEKIRNLDERLRIYRENCDTVMSGYKTEMTSQLEGWTTSANKPTLNVSVFDDYLRKVFSMALKIVATKKLLPNLENETISIGTLLKHETELIGNMGQLSADLDKGPTPPVVQLAKEMLELDGRISSEIKNIDKIITSAEDLFKSDKDNGVMNLKNRIVEFTKTLIYNAANTWSWDSPNVSSRALSTLTNYAQTREFNADRNIFLYNLDALDDDYKQRILLIFAKYHQYIVGHPTDGFIINTFKKKEKVEEPLSGPQLKKFRVMAETFCYEVFFNFGAYGNRDASQTQVFEYSKEIVLANEVLTEWDEITNEENAYENLLVKQMNEIGGKLDNKIESFDVSEEDAPATKTPKPSKFFMNYNSVIVAYNLLKERLLTTSSGGGGGGAAGSIFGGSRSKGTADFHPLLPIHIMLYQLSKTVANENFKTSMDFELVLQLYDFLLMAIEIVKKNAQKGIIFRDLFFIDNCLDKIPKRGKMMSLIELLTTRFCGKLNTEYFEDYKSQGMNAEFLETLNTCMKTPYDMIVDKIDYDTFVKAVSLSAKEVANEIIGNREIKIVSKRRYSVKKRAKSKSYMKTNSNKKYSKRKSRPGLKIFI